MAGTPIEEKQILTLFRRVTYLQGGHLIEDFLLFDTTTARAPLSGIRSHLQEVLAAVLQRKGGRFQRVRALLPSNLCEGSYCIILASIVFTS